MKTIIFGIVVVLTSAVDVVSATGSHQVLKDSVKPEHTLADLNPPVENEMMIIRDSNSLYYIVFDDALYSLKFDIELKRQEVGIPYIKKPLQDFDADISAVLSANPNLLRIDAAIVGFEDLKDLQSLKDDMASGEHSFPLRLNPEGYFDAATDRASFAHIENQKDHNENVPVFLIHMATVGVFGMTFLFNHWIEFNFPSARLKSEWMTAMLAPYIPVAVVKSKRIAKVLLKKPRALRWALYTAGAVSAGYCAPALIQFSHRFF